MENLIWAAPAAGVLALVYAAWKANWVKNQPAGDEKMQKIAGLIRTGAMAFLAREYKVLAVFVALVAVVLVGIYASQTGIEAGLYVAGAFVLGAFASALSGFFGMRVATLANSRTTWAARTGLAPALAVAFGGGSVMGMVVVGLGLMGLSLVFVGLRAATGSVSEALTLLAGFSMGASSIALFARVGGGIYTKAADVGADLVGKVEAGLPEDDPRNPATIADNVGDNVGDVAGMGADLFESYVGSIVGAMMLGLAVTSVSAGGLHMWPILAPLMIAAVGIVASIIGSFFVRTKEGGNPQLALDAGSFGAAGVTAILSYFIIAMHWPEDGMAGGRSVTAMGVWLANTIGLAVGVAVGMITSYYCSIGKRPVLSIGNSTKTGPATTIITGIAVGMESTAIPLLLIAAGTIGAFHFAGIYGVALAGLGMLSTTGIQLAVDAYGPIADNAGGIAEMTHQAPEVRERTDTLDAVGNTTAAIGKGFAIASAAMTALALFVAYQQATGLASINLARPDVMAMIFVGGMLPFLFSSMAMLAVGRSAGDMVEEVRRQFREIPGLLEGTADPDTARCVDISTKAAIREMVLPGVLAVSSPVIVGFALGTAPLAGLLAGCTVSGVLLAIFMSNAGGAWDNAKKSFEGAGFTMTDGSVHPKKSPAHQAAVTGDTVGDPFKDTAGPSLNILIKLMTVVALVLAPVLPHTGFIGLSDAEVGEAPHAEAAPAAPAAEAAPAAPAANH